MRKSNNIWYTITLVSSLLCMPVLAQSQGNQIQSPRYRIDHMSTMSNPIGKATPTPTHKLTKPRKSSPTETTAPPSYLQPDTATPKSKNHILGITNKKTFNNKGYVIQSHIEPISIDASTNKITMDYPPPHKPEKRTLTYIVHYVPHTTYQVYMLTANANPGDKNLVLQPTSCNSSKRQCIVTHAMPWDDPNRTGIGYSMQGNHAPSDFKNESYYRPFPNTDKIPLLITTTSSPTNSSKETHMTIKVNTPSHQQISTYKKTISLFFVPSIR